MSNSLTGLESGKDLLAIPIEHVPRAHFDAPEMIVARRHIRTPVAMLQMEEQRPARR